MLEELRELSLGHVVCLFGLPMCFWKANFSLLNLYSRYRRYCCLLQNLDTWDSFQIILFRTIYCVNCCDHTIISRYQLWILELDLSLSKRMLIGVFNVKQERMKLFDLLQFCGWRFMIREIDTQQLFVHYNIHRISHDHHTEMLPGMMCTKWTAYYEEVRVNMRELEPTLNLKLPLFNPLLQFKMNMVPKLGQTWGLVSILVSRIMEKFQAWGSTRK